MNSSTFIEAIQIFYSLAMVTSPKLKTCEPDLSLNVLSKIQAKLLVAHSVTHTGQVIV